MKPSDKQHTGIFHGLDGTIVVGVILGTIVGNVIYMIGDDSFSIGQLVISVLGGIIGLLVVAWLVRRFRSAE